MSKEKQLSLANYNLAVISPIELEQHLQMSISFKQNVAVFGIRGTGKSELVAQVISDLGFLSVFLNLALVDKPELAGYPDLIGKLNDIKNADDAAKQRFVKFLLPYYYEELIKPAGPNGPQVVLILDEIDKADRSVESPVLEILQTKTSNGLLLPNLRCVIMTGNLLSEGARKPSAPLLDRCEAFLVEADFNSFENYSRTRGHIHPAVMTYLREHPDHLQAPVSEDNRYKDVSPRSWKRASDILYAAERESFSFKNHSSGESPEERFKHILKQKVCSCVGNYMGKKFELYYEHYVDLIPLADLICQENVDKKIIKDKYDALLHSKDGSRQKQIFLSMIVGSRLAIILSTQKPATFTEQGLKLPTYKEKVEKSIQSIANFLDIIPLEDLMMVFRSQLGQQVIFKHVLDKRPGIGPVIEKIISFAEEQEYK